MITYPPAAMRAVMDAVKERVMGPPPFLALSNAGNPNLLPVAPAVVFNEEVLDGLEVGDAISGVNIAPGSHIVSITNNQITMDQNGAAPGAALVFDATRGSPQIHLYKATGGPGPNPTPASFTECDFDTYAALPLANPIGPFTDPSGQAELDYDAAWVLSADPVVGNTVLGYWIDALVNGVRSVIAWEAFTPALPMTSAGNAVSVVVELTLPQAQGAVVL